MAQEQDRAALTIFTEMYRTVYSAQNIFAALFRIISKLYRKLYSKFKTSIFTERCSALYPTPKLTDGSSKMTVELIWIMDHGFSHQLGKVGTFNFKPLLVKIISINRVSKMALNLYEGLLGNLRRRDYQLYLMP